jgi:DNA-damage-inducible protein J
MAAESVVRARIDKQVKADASEVLEAMGLSMSDAIRLLLVRVAKDKALPFEVKMPNAETREAIADLEAGKGERFESVEALMADLNADD